jgi:predicted O-methyltransferase YrrM
MITPAQFLPSLRSALRLKSEAIALRKALDSSAGFADMVSIAVKSRAFTANQKPSEILQLLELLATRPPRNICEIGSARGGTLALFSSLASVEAKIISLDLNYPLSRRFANRYLARGSQKIKCLRCDSHTPQAVELVRNWIYPDKLDFLFIDGDHSFAGVKSDFEMYSPLVRSGGIVAFHDIVPDNQMRCGKFTGTSVGEVPNFWTELKRQHVDAQDLIASPDQDGYGIGVLQIA